MSAFGMLMDTRGCREFLLLKLRGRILKTDRNKRAEKLFKRLEAGRKEITTAGWC